MLLVSALGAALLKTIIYESYVLLNVDSTSTVAELEAVTVESKVNPLALAVTQDGADAPLLCNSCPEVPAAVNAGALAPAEYKTPPAAPAAVFA